MIEAGDVEPKSRGDCGGNEADMVSDERAIRNKRGYHGGYMPRLRTKVAVQNR